MAVKPIKKTKKAVFFTIDSLLASGIIIVAILLVATFYSANRQPVNINYASRDMVRVFSALKVGEVNNDYVKSLIASGDITNVNNTILGQIGSFWAEDKMELAKNFTKNLTEDVFPPAFGFSVLVDNELVYSRNISVKRSLVSSRKLISGIAKAKPTEGFTARVLLNGIKSKRTNAYAYFGGYEGDGNLTKILALPNDVISFNSSYLEVDAGTNFDLYVNGAYSGTYAKGSGGGGFTLADKWNISGAYLSNFVPGVNTISLNFTGNGSGYVAGGFLRVAYTTSSYNDTLTPGFEKYLFPGIDGVINLYSSVYFPDRPGSMNISLRFLSQYPLTLNLGNTTIFESTPSANEQVAILNDSNISSRLDYALLNQKTLPIRLGLKSTNVTISGKISDSALITDRTSSMSACDVDVNCTAGLCDSNADGGCHDRRDNVAIKADKKFIDETLKVQGSKVGLVGYGESLYPFCDFHDFSSDNTSLAYRINNYSNSWCGNTCISCGILAATELLLEKEALHGLNENFYANSTQVHLGDSGQGVSIVQKLNFSIDKSKFVKSRLSIFGKGIAVNSGYHDCVYLNQKYIGRLCDSSAGWHTCSFPLKAEWFSDSGNNFTITGGTKSGCFQTAGDNDDWDFNNVKLSVWESQSLPKTEYNSSLGEVQIGDAPFQQIETLLLNISANKTKVRAAYFEFDAVDVNSSYFDCIYINGNYAGRLDYQKWNGTGDPNAWQRVIFDVPAAWIQDINQINLTSGTTSGCLRVSGENDEWRFRNANLSVVWTDETPSYDMAKSMLIMSDGQANTKIGDCDGCDSAGARAETIQKACEAKSEHGISIYAVAFGNVGSTAIDTLNQSACCDDCSHFYTSNNSDELIEIYTKIAQSIGNITYKEQSVNLSGMLRTILYPDSYIAFNYTAPEIQFNKLPLGFETDRFGNNISSGALTIYANTSVADAKVTSYSGSRWTDKLVVNGNAVYRLADYGSDYLPLGDPFAVSIPISSINEGSNAIIISTGLNSTNSTGGSGDNRAIYTLLLNTFADYSGVVAKSDGCSWTIGFEDGTAAIIKVPSAYGGADICSFSAGTYDPNDALDNTAYQLFKYLDIDKDGKLDVNIDSGNLNVNTLTISKVPSLWGPAIAEIRVWE